MHIPIPTGMIVTFGLLLAAALTLVWLIEVPRALIVIIIVVAGVGGVESYIRAKDN